MPFPKDRSELGSLRPGRVGEVGQRPRADHRGNQEREGALQDKAMSRSSLCGTGVAEGGS